MMNGFITPGLPLSAMSGTSYPAHFTPSHSISLRVGSHALPDGSAEQRLYMRRRLAGHENAHCGNKPVSSGSLLLRRAMLFPASVKQPVLIQQAADVVPSSRSAAKPASCLPCSSRFLLGSLGSFTVCSAEPLISRASSSGLGSFGSAYAQRRFTIGSGTLPPSFRYSAFSRRWSCAMIQTSCLASPGGVPPAQCHCSQRPEFTSAPSSSAKHVDGNSKTSVWILDESTSLYSPWFCQNRAVSVCSGSIDTRNLSFDSAAVSFLRLGADSRGLNPWQKYPVILPWCISSNARSMS